MEILRAIQYETAQYQNDPQKVQQMVIRSFGVFTRAIMAVIRSKDIMGGVKIITRFINYFVRFADLSNKDMSQLIEKNLEQLKYYSQKLKYRRGMIDYYRLKALYNEKKGNIKVARDNYLKAIEESEKKAAFLTDDEEEKMNILRRNNALYKKTSEILVKNKEPQKAFEILQRLNNSQVKSIDIAKVKAKDPKLQKVLKQVGTLRSKNSKIQKELSMEQKKPEHAQDKNKIERLTKTLALNKSEFYKNINVIKKVNPEYERLISIRPARFAKIQKLIPNDTIMVQYLPALDKIYIFLITKDSLKIKTVKASKEELDRLVKRFRKAMKAALGDFTRGTETLDLKPSRKNKMLVKNLKDLYNILIRPIESDIKPKKVVAIIPTGLLYYMPFQVLAKTMPKGGVKYFIENKEIIYLSSADLDILNRHNNKEGAKLGRLLAFGNPDGTLKNAEVETKKIKEIFPNTVLYHRGEATKDKIKKAPENLRVLHLATHGVLNSNDVNESYIVTAGKGKKGKLKQGEIFGLPLENTSLVTLSACQTALGERAPGSEIASLASAFSIAGSPSILATLWSISDESTSFFMTEFYIELKKGKSKAEALRNAQVKMLRNPKYKHPFFWAPYILIGDWNPI